tara:strand:- start:131 stop:463 length:333 start_codon:yes stop_codon:yes gene_type:complete
LVSIIFKLPDGKSLTVKAKQGMTLLEVAWENRIKIEGVCGGAMACSTCHLIICPSWAKNLPKISDEESEMLDLTWGRLNTSRLACQIIVTDELNGLVVSVPAEQKNLLDY